MVQSPKEKHVSYEQLIEKLLREQKRLEDATSYRQNTARQAIELVQIKRNPYFYLRDDVVVQWLEEKFPEINHERAADIAKYIRVIVKELIREQFMSASMRKRIEERKKGRLTFEKMQ